MSRESDNEYRFGRVWNGYDYKLQAWVWDGVVQGCSHPEWMRNGGKNGSSGPSCCKAYQYGGCMIQFVDPTQCEVKEVIE